MSIEMFLLHREKLLLLGKREKKKLKIIISQDFNIVRKKLRKIHEK